MSPRLPEHIDPIRLARTGRVLEGCLKLGAMRRLAGALNSAEGDVEVVLAFDVDASGVPYVRGSARARLELTCQRCMGPMPWPVQAQFALGLVTSEAQCEQLPEEYEALMVTPEPMLLSDIVEDELILALPIVATHPLEKCPAAQYVTGDTGAKPDTARRDNPFAALAALKKGRNTQSND